MTRMLMLAAAATMAVACSPDDSAPDAAGEPPAANETAAAPPADAAPSAPANAAAATNPPPTVRVVPARDIPPAFHGVYDGDRAACGRPSEYRLTVTARELRFHESIGAVRAVAVEDPEAIHVTADYQGEGESWTNVRRLRLADGGATLTITGEGTSLTRVRCPALPSGS